MAQNIPPEAQALIDAFNIEESHGKIDSEISRKRIQEIKKELRELETFFKREWTVPALQSLARKNGWILVGSNNHFKYQNPVDAHDFVTIPMRPGKQNTVSDIVRQNTLNSVLASKIQSLSEELSQLEKTKS